MFQMSKKLPFTFGALSIDRDDDSDLESGPDGFDQCTNDLAESFVAFIEGHYIETSEVKSY